MEPNRKPRVTGTTHPLPFAALSAGDFERLTLWLVQREGFERAQHLGEAGNDQGRDIEAWRDGRRFAFQCKRVKAFSAGDGEKEIAKLRKLPQERQPAEVVFVLYIPLLADTRERIWRAWGDEATCQFWVGSELDERVKRHPEIVREFFQIDAEPQRIVFLGQTRAPSLTFVGRTEDLADLEAKLTASGKVAIQAAITGLAGIGKTELALHYAHFKAKEALFPGGVTWLDASTDLQGQWARLAPRIGLPAGSIDPREIEPAVLSELAARPRLLVVLDNAESWQALQGHLPLGGTAHAYLVTTRERGFARAQFQHLALGLLDDPSARELVRTMMDERAESHPEEVDLLVEAFAGHALALEVAGAYLAHHSGTPAEEIAKGWPKEIGRRDLEGIQYGKTFGAMIEDLLVRLTQDEPGAARLFPLLGLFGEAPAPIGLLEGVWNEVAEGPFEEAFESLSTLHLLDRVAPDGWTTHRLIRSEARERLARNGRDEDLGRRAVAAKLTQALWVLDEFDRRGYAKLKPHVEQAAGWGEGTDSAIAFLQEFFEDPWSGGLALSRPRR